MLKLVSCALPIALLAACTLDVAPDPTDQGLTTTDAVNPDIRPDGRHGGTVHTWAGGKSGGAPIQYHGGPVIEGTVNVYYIWYGNWSGNSATTILTDMANAIGGTPYYRINAGYYDIVSSVKHYVSGAIHYAGSTTDAYSYGTALDDTAVFAVVDDAITSGRLPEDTNGMYFVITSADVNETTGFCTQYCGWHWNDVDSYGTKIRYSFIGNADRCPSACMAQTTGPNGNAGADGMASIITHELEEANTDPDGNAWYDSRGYEDADKCAWTFGTTKTASNGSKYNVTWGARNYLIQQEWKVSGGCALQ